MDSIDIKKLPTESTRAFARVGSVDVSPDAFYDAYNVENSDRAVFTIRPADAVVRDELKSVVLTTSEIKNSIALQNNTTVSTIYSSDREEFNADTEANAPDGKIDVFREARERLWAEQETAKRSIKQTIYTMCEYEKTTTTVRELLAKCVDSVDNYKQLNADGELVLSTDTTNKIIADAPQAVISFLFSEIQTISNLSEVEAMGF